MVFGSIREEPGANEGGIDGLAAVTAQLGLLRSDERLRRLIVTRALLLSTALANAVAAVVALAMPGLLAGGVIAQWLGIGAVLVMFTLMGAMAMRAAAGLDEAQAT